MSDFNSKSLSLHEFRTAEPTAATETMASPRAEPRPGWAFAKRVFDIGFSLGLLPVLLALVPVLWLANRRRNPGPLFFLQTRMGRHCRPFTLVKFRTMVPAGAAVRGFDDPLEVDRITPLGAFLRKTRIDELPQILNILHGEMSVIGPRPDVWEHATVYCRIVPGYRERHQVRPGITGLAQTRIGYADGLNATRRKAFADNIYIRNMGFGLELLILRQTVGTVLSGFGLGADTPMTARRRGEPVRAAEDNQAATPAFGQAV